MIASIFNKTRPINYLIVALSLFLMFFCYSISNEIFNGWDGLLKASLHFLIVISSCFLVNFISLKNFLTKNDTYSILFFTIFLLFFPTIFESINVLISNVFLLMATRRLLSMKSMKELKEKIFDASFWIFFAVLFHFWSVLYLLMVFISIVFHASRDYKNWIIPFIALFCVSILFLMYDFENEHEPFDLVVKKIGISFDFSYFRNIYQNIALAIFSSIAFLFFLSTLMTISATPVNLQMTYKKVLFSFLIGVSIYIFSLDKNNSQLLFCLAPLSIMGANFLENLKSKVIKEIVIYGLLILGIFLFIMQL